MSRFARLFFTVLLTAVASCQDRNEILAPVAGAGEMAPAFAGGNANGNGGAMASPNAGPHAAGGSAGELPGAAELASVARYLPGQSPGAEIAGTFIGPEGGSLRLGDFEVVVPPGAVASATRFQILVLPGNGPETHAAAQFFPHNQQFDVPVTLRVPHAGTEAAADQGAHVLWWDSGAWEEMQTTLTADGRLETTTDHFSLWATQRRMGLTIIGG